MKVLLINSSPNEKGNIYFLLTVIQEKLEQYDIDCEMIYLQSALDDLRTPYCTCCSSPCSRVCYEGTLLEDVFDKMVSADFIVFGSPVYFGTTSAQLKVLFDKSRYYRSKRALLNKFGAAVTCGGSKYGGQETTVKAIHDMMLVQGMTIVGSGSMEGGAHHQGVCAHAPAKNDKDAIESALSLANRIISLE